MKTCQYVAAKRAIRLQMPIEQETYDALVNLRDTFQKHVSECTVKGDVAQAMYFNESKMEINSLLEKAIIAKPEGE